jgi:hypothetical protein
VIPFSLHRHDGRTLALRVSGRAVAFGARQDLAPCRVIIWQDLEHLSWSREIYAVNFGFVASLIVIIAAVLSVFIEIPIVSNYAFWFAVGAYIMLAGTR